MRHLFFAALGFCFLAGAAGMWLTETLDRPAAAANGDFRAFAPGVAREVAVQATPSPTPTPPGGGGGGNDGSLEIFVAIDMVAKEASTDADGTVDIPIGAAAWASFPAPDDAPVTVAGSVVIDPHPVDAAGCTWSRTYASTEFTMTVLAPNAGSDEVFLSFTAPEWHYTITCPEPGYVTRYPAFGEQAMLAFLGYAFPEYSQQAAIPLDVPPVSATSQCIKREAIVERTVQLAYARVHVVIYEPPCELPAQ